MPIGPDLCWVVMVLGAAAWLFRLSTRRASVLVGILLCLAVITFPIISWDDDVLRGRRPDEGGVWVSLDRSRGEKHAPLTDGVFRPVLSTMLPSFQSWALVNPPTHGGGRAVSVAYLPLGQRPPPIHL